MLTDETLLAQALSMEDRNVCTLAKKAGLTLTGYPVIQTRMMTCFLVMNRELSEAEVAELKRTIARFDCSLAEVDGLVQLARHREAVKASQKRRAIERRSLAMAQAISVPNCSRNSSETA